MKRFQGNMLSKKRGKNSTPLLTATLLRRNRGLTVTSCSRPWKLWVCCCYLRVTAGAQTNPHSLRKQQSRSTQSYFVNSSRTPMSTFSAFQQSLGFIDVRLTQNKKSSATSHFGCIGSYSHEMSCMFKYLSSPELWLPPFLLRLHRCIWALQFFRSALNNNHDLIKRLSCPPSASHPSPRFKKDWSAFFHRTLSRFFSLHVREMLPFLLCLFHQIPERYFSSFLNGSSPLTRVDRIFSVELQGDRCLVFEPRGFSCPGSFKSCKSHCFSCHDDCAGRSFVPVAVPEFSVRFRSFHTASERMPSLRSGFVRHPRDGRKHLCLCRLKRSLSSVQLSPSLQVLSATWHRWILSPPSRKCSRSDTLYRSFRFLAPKRGS